MVSPLESQIKAEIAKGFKGKLLKGTFRRVVADGLNAYGDPDSSTPSDVQEFAFEGHRESFSARYKAQSGIPAEDVSILILQGLFNPPTTIRMDDVGSLVFIGVPWNKWHKIRAILAIDPAGASAQLQCYEVPAPE